MMNKTLNLLSTFVVIFMVIRTNSYSQTIKEYDCKWHSATDSIYKEEMLDRMSYNEKAELFFSITHDDRNLYIDIIPGDENLARKILMFGMTTWIDPAAKKKKDMGVVFPIAETRENAPRGGNGDDMDNKGATRGEDRDRSAEMEKMLNKKNERLALLGFTKGGSREVIELMYSTEYRSLIFLEDERLQIQMQLPLESISPDLVDGSLDKLSIGFETGYLEMSQQRQQASMGRKPGGGRGGGMGGPPGGGNRSGASGGMDMQVMMQPTKLWLKEVRLEKLGD